MERKNEDVSSRHYVNYEPHNCLAERWDFLDDAIYAFDAATTAYPTNMVINPILQESVGHAILRSLHSTSFWHHSS